MGARSRWLTLAAVTIIGAVAFFTGRHFEARALAAKVRATAHGSLVPLLVNEIRPAAYRELAVTEILALSFSDFYEALRSAPEGAREKWASELAAMPDGPRRTAAVSGFYKLLVQFDPAAGIKAIREIEDVKLQGVALGSAVDAAPGFAMPELAALCLSLQNRMATSSNRDYLNDVLLEWMQINAPAVARFIDDNPGADDLLAFPIRQFLVQQLISTWAALDPKAAKQWVERKEEWEVGAVRDAFIEGWYENDRAAAVSYVLAHVEDPDMGEAIADVVRNLYFDSKEEAAKFIESLPEDKRPDALREAFRRFILVEEAGVGDPARTTQAVASWMTEFPPFYWKGALATVFRWSDPGEAGMLGWIERLPPALREAAAAEYPPIGTSTSEAITPILRVADPTLRDQLFRATLINSSAKSKEAKAAVTAAAISSEQKNHLLQIIAAVEVENNHDYGSEK